MTRGQHICSGIAHEKNAAAADKSVEFQFERARKQYDRSLQVQREHAAREGKSSAELGRTLVAMGAVLSVQGKYEEALEKLTEGLQILRKEVGNDHMDVAHALISIGLV